VYVPIPVHQPRRPRRPGSPAGRGARLIAVLVAVFSTLAAALVGSLMNASRPHDSGDYVVLGLLVAVGAVAGGFAIAKAIGRQGRV
jgi:hypothetical protein